MTWPNRCDLFLLHSVVEHELVQHTLRCIAELWYSYLFLDVLSTCKDLVTLSD